MFKKLKPEKIEIKLSERIYKMSDPEYTGSGGYYINGKTHTDLHHYKKFNVIKPNTPEHNKKDANDILRSNNIITYRGETKINSDKYKSVKLYDTDDLNKHFCI